ncbi:DUF1761 domain-containing protein [Candidatus Saccharibacteria bacterium]|nr:DUF1761 domain-containing protein [Candidatus Saccharibacteria bacterium]
MEVVVNYWAVLFAALSSMVVGSLWYSPAVFGKTWEKTFKQNKKRAKKEMPLVMFVTLVASLLMAYILAHVAYLANQFFGNSFLQDTMTTAVFLWLGFSVPAILGGLFEQRRKAAMMLQIGNVLVTLEVMALIIGLMGV